MFFYLLGDIGISGPVSVAIKLPLEIFSIPLSNPLNLNGSAKNLSADPPGRMPAFMLNAHSWRNISLPISIKSVKPKCTP
jgi:hypothetical protein